MISPQEKAEEAAKEYVKSKWGSIFLYPEIEKSFIEGAKWQQERMYSEEEVRQMLFDLGDVLFNNHQNGIEEGEPEKYFDEIIESLKKNNNI